MKHILKAIFGIFCFFIGVMTGAKDDETQFVMGVLAIITLAWMLFGDEN